MNDNNEQIVLETLDRLHIKYDITEHPAVFTIEDMNTLGIILEGNVVKNLFFKKFKWNKSLSFSHG